MLVRGYRVEGCKSLKLKLTNQHASAVKIEQQPIGYIQRRISGQIVGTTLSHLAMIEHVGGSANTVTRRLCGHGARRLCQVCGTCYNMECK